jgi:hypothetical protein
LIAATAATLAELALGGQAGATTPGDPNHDGIINQLDLNIVVAHWQQMNVGYDGGDFNADGFVNQLDLNLITANWQKTAEPSGVDLAGAEWAGIVPEPTALSAPGDPTHDGMINRLDLSVAVGHWQQAIVGFSDGDINGDHVVNQLDLNIIVGNWLMISSEPFGGDINADGIVNQIDLNIVIRNWQRTAAPSGVELSDVQWTGLVPEPAALSVPVDAGLATLARRRRPRPA